MAKVKGSAMVPIYGKLVMDGIKKLSDVPEAIRQEVADWVIEHGGEIPEEE